MMSCGYRAFAAPSSSHFTTTNNCGRSWPPRKGKHRRLRTHQRTGGSMSSCCPNELSITLCVKRVSLVPVLSRYDQRSDSFKEPRAWEDAPPREPPLFQISYEVDSPKSKGYPVGVPPSFILMHVLCRLSLVVAALSLCSCVTGCIVSIDLHR